MKAARSKSKMTTAQLAQYVNTQISYMRMRLGAFLGNSHDGARDLYTAFGYERNVQVEHLEAMYHRNDVANRIVSAFPAATWGDAPIVGDDRGDSPVEKKGAQFSPFALAWKDLNEKLSITHYLERADRLASIGQFGLLLLGFKDSAAMDQPIKGKAELMYLQPYAQSAITVNKWVIDPKSPRFGLPEIYSIIQGADESVAGATAMPRQTIRVHHSRTIHISEFLDQSEVLGRPRLLAIYNRLKDLEKVVGGASENYWITANRGTFFELDKESDTTPEEMEDFKTQIEEFQHSLRRSLIGRGMKPTVLGGQDQDPSMIANILLDLIAGAVGMPKRILVGSERGELASSQDETNWSSRIDERRRNFAVPKVLRPIIQVLVDTGNLPAPAGKFYCQWPESDLGPTAQATILAQRTQALTTYANSPTASLIVPEAEFRRDFLGISPESDYEPMEMEDPLDEEGLEGEGAPDKPDDGQEPVAEDEGNEVTSRNGFKNAAPRSLYVSRKLLNTGAIIKWAKSQGFRNIEDDLHVTVMYSQKPVDWMMASQAWDTDENGGMTVAPGGPRLMERFEPSGAVVLSFSSNNLYGRHSELRGIGCEHGREMYQPHVTISYDGEIDLTKIEPYQGVLSFGPEIFRETKRED